MIYDKAFLKDLDLCKEKKIYARITLLTLDEHPIEYIEGRVTSGSLNIDGNSTIRRSCNLTLVNTDAQDYQWSLKSKFKLEIGLQNDINPSYPNIIWFKQGLFLITAFSSSVSTSGSQVSISGKDKMCLLNGEIGGKINSSVDFGSFEEVNDKGDISVIKMPIKQIIREGVHQYGNEPFHNIIINDLDIVGLELQEYMYDIPMYLFRRVNDSSGLFFNGTLNGDQPCYLNGVETKLSAIPRYDNFAEDLMIGNEYRSIVKLENTPESEEIYVAKIEFGQTAGYKEIDLVYPDELISRVGEAFTAILDKIKNMLGNYEYFYDVDGRFVFQKKRIYLDSSWNPISQEGGEIKVNTIAESESYSYSFVGSETFTQVSNAPQLSNLRNDFTVWGTRRSVTGQELPMHMRYAIDVKPKTYTSITVTKDELIAYNKKYGLNVQEQISKTYIASTDTYKEDTVNNIVYCDWRELIYQMAKDYRKFNHLDNFENKVAQANLKTYPTGKTGYEQYYIDIEGFWRTCLYNPAGDADKFYLSDSANYCWAKALFERPESLEFWFDFLDSEGVLAQYSVPVIGSRPFVENDSAVKAIYYNTPQVIFYDLSTEDLYDDKGNNSAYRYFNIGSSGFKDMFSKSAQGKSAKDAIDSLLYSYSYCSESINISAIPVYYLEPNTRIYINDPISGIEGEFMLNKISIPLNSSGTMSLSAIKIQDKLL